MKITGVRTQPYQIQLHRPIGDANNPDGGRLMPSEALFLDTDEGLSGISFGGGPMVSELVEQVLMGKDPRG
ncbi:MAG: mandelate racemase/muconate lactonizing enzyme family protein, partial [Candidatus Latescibacterota bacterium]|nr:mandelate racemase/muconate lactonizing enzyme family protein [Candidatus Latescibacterota bacterium]